MSDYSNGEMCPECDCSIMDGTDVCYACGWGMDDPKWDDDYDDQESST
jgi:hypothetical protein